MGILGESRLGIETCHSLQTHHHRRHLSGQGSIREKMTSPSGSQTYAVMQMDREMQMELDDSRRAGPSSANPDTRIVTRRNKAVAAISGAAVTSLLSE